MFGLDPFSRLVAIAEILLLLSLAALTGWLLGRLFLQGRIKSLRGQIARKESELETCRRQKAGKPSQSAEPARPMAAPADAPADRPLLPAMPAPVPNVPVEVTPLAANVPNVTPTPIAGVAPGSPEEAVLQRIGARAGEINFDRIGRAAASEADDLKVIVGIGPFLERKLHAIGIYTFRQVASFTKEDIQKVNEIIEFFPGRIERDNWVSQAKAFYDRKDGPTDN